MPEKPAASTRRASVATLSQVVARVMTSNSMGFFLYRDAVGCGAPLPAALPWPQQVGQVCHRRRPPTMPTAQGRFDYIVVGAGSAGATIASRLTESGAHRVLLLEAGTEESSYFWS